MRIKAKIVGIGERRSGTSKKTNRPYDFTPIHFIYEDRNTEGFAAATSNVDQGLLETIPFPKVNDEVEMFCHFYNNSLTIDVIL